MRSCGGCIICCFKSRHSFRVSSNLIMFLVKCSVLLENVNALFAIWFSVNLLPVSHKIWPSGTTINTVGIEFNGVLNVVACSVSHNCDHKKTLRFANTMCSGNFQNIPPRIECITVPPEPRMLNAGKGNNAVEKTKCSSVEFSHENIWSHRFNHGMSRTDVPILKCDNTASTSCEDGGFNPWIFAADHQHATAIYVRCVAERMF